MRFSALSGGILYPIFFKIQALFLFFLELQRYKGKELQRRREGEYRTPNVEHRMWNAARGVLSGELISRLSLVASRWLVEFKMFLFFWWGFFDNSAHFLAVFWQFGALFNIF